jgi:hypothetical protein
LSTILTNFISSFLHYSIELLPALAIGLVISGIVNECISTRWVEKHLGGKGVRGVLLSTIVGSIVPVCCWGSLPIAVSFKKKGASLGPIFALLIATPATSINAVVVMWRLMGFTFAMYVFVSVIVMGVIAGLIGNLVPIRNKEMKNFEDPHGHSHGHQCDCACSGKKKGFWDHFKSVLKYAFITMPKEIGLEMVLGIALAALVASFDPIGILVENYLKAGYDFLFSGIFGLTVYMCATMSIPLVHAFVGQGLNTGAGLMLLIVGPIASYGTILVIRKEFGWKVLVLFLSLVTIFALIAGLGFNVLLNQ